jgi:hypothetical protein
MRNDATQKTCSICGKPIAVNAAGWAGGNNAEPVNDGRCCDICNDMVVLPRRIRDMAREGK